MNGAEILIRSLEDQGVKIVFGYPGGAMLEIYEAIAKSDIYHVLARHEQNAAHEASGYARASGDVGVCMATSGPGATNLVTGIATAYMDSIPLVAITGQVAKRLIGTDAFQETDITGVVNPITKHNLLVTSAKDIPRVVAEAFYIARSGRPGPVLLDIPRDVSQEIGDYIPHKKVEIRSYQPTIYGHELMVKRAAKLIAQSENMVVIVGGGVVSAQAGELVQELIERKGCGAVATMMGLGGIPSSHPHFLGMLGTYGSKAANQAVQSAELIFALGTRFDDRITNESGEFAQRAKIIHVDIDPAEIGKNIEPYLPIVGDVGKILEQIKLELDKEEIKHSSFVEPAMKIPCSSNRAQEIFSAINASVDLSHTVFTTDVGQHQIWAANYLKIERHHQFISSGGLGTMGYGIPAAVGAQMACPEDLVVAVTGDGSFQMGMGELGTILAENLPIKIILLNNNSLGMVKQLQYHYFKENYVQVNLGSGVDFRKLVGAYGFKSYKINQGDRPEEILQKAFAESGCVLIECSIPPEDKCWPIVLAGDAIDSMHEAL